MKNRDSLAPAVARQAATTPCPTRSSAVASRSLAALLISPDQSDEAFFADLFQRQKWDLRTVRSLSIAMDALQEEHFPVVITEKDLRLGDWKDVLAAVEELSAASLLVVTSRLADEHLWSEVLNLGGHDVLAKPFREPEVRHVLTHAWQRLTGAEPVSSAGSEAKRASRRVPTQAAHVGRCA